MTDNFKLSFTGVDKTNLIECLEILLTNHSKVVGYRIVGTQLVFYWYDEKFPDYQKFPFSVSDAGFLADYIVKWLDVVDYGEEPYHDGSNKKGYCIYSLNDNGVSFAVKPVWAEYHK